MKKRLFFCLLMLFNLSILIASSPKTIMLVLGSDKSNVLTARVQLAYKLYKVQHIDKIIVSGGCGAHASSICEATIMYDGLVKLGVKASKIYKEENSKSTVQNYVFSRVLKDEFNQNIIQKADTVFVVSDHWHAIAVAARLKKYDAVEAKFFIEGDITPKIEDKLDYVSIMNGESDNAVFIKKALWLTPQASWKGNGKTNYLMDSMIYSVEDRTNAIEGEILRNDVFRGIGDITHSAEWSFIDNRTTWLIKISDTLYELDKVSFNLRRSYLWKDLIMNLPDKWLVNGFNAGIILDNKLVLFANDAVCIAIKKNKKFVFEKEGHASDLISEWPFSWGKSNVSGVGFEEESKSFILYRNREYLKIDKFLKVTQQPIKLNVKWINNQ